MADKGPARKNCDPKHLRKEKKIWRQRLDPAQAGEWSERIAGRLMEWILDPASVFTSASEPEPVYLCYASVKNEVCLDACYKQLLARGKRLYFPKTDGKTMDFFEIRDLRKDFVIGSFGIREPAAGEKYDGSRRAAAFVPGVAFDEQGNRIGYGGGYYDRYFGRYPDIVRLGICYEKQLTEKITPAPWDVPMDALVTENRVICERSRLWN